MAAIRLDSFAGLNLEKDPRKGPFWQALVAKNLDVKSGSIEPIYGLGTASAEDLATGLAGFVFGGTASNQITTNSSAADACTAQFDLKAHITADDYTNGSQMLTSRAQALAAQHFRLYIGATGLLNFEYWNGTVMSGAQASTATLGSAGAVDGEDIHIRVTRDGSTGLLKFYTSTDGSTWTQLGADVTTNVENMAVPVGVIVYRVGCDFGGGMAFAGQIHSFQLYSTIDDTSSLVTDLNPTDYSSGASLTSSETGETWTISGDVSVTSRAYKALYHLAGPGVGYDTDIFLAADTNTDYALSPLADNSERRVYYTSRDVHEPRVANAATAAVEQTAAYPTHAFVLGVPGQPVIGSATASGGSGLVQDRAYVYTHVTAWGEEGPPSTPKSITANETDATVLLERMGVTTRCYAGSPAVPNGIPAAVTFVGTPTPGYLQFNLSSAGYQDDVRVGDRIYCSSPGTPTAGNRDYVVSDVDNTGNGWVRVASNAWDMAASSTLFRVLPANTFNIRSVSGGASDADLTFNVDTIEGLRLAEKVGFANVDGLGQDEYFVSELIDTVGAPAFKVANESAETPVVAADPYAYRIAKHNTGEVQILAMTIAAGVVTVTVENNAQIAVDDKLLIVGVQGAVEANGVRTVTEVPAGGTQFKFALASMTTYTNGGMVLLAIPYNYREFTVSNVTSAGGPYPTPFEITITLDEPHDFEAGEMAIGYDIGGAVEANTVMVVSSVTASTVVCSAAQGVTAYTSGGKLARVERQSRKRIYRTATGTVGAEYQLVEELPSETCRYSDTKNDSALGYVLESDGWIGPPADMHSIIAHPHGFLQGLAGNIFCQSVPGFPHAWPLSHQRALPADGVGLGQYGITTVAFTLDKPFLISGSEPLSMRRERYNAGESCTSKRSIASGLEGVAYRGKTGMHLIGIQGVNTTKDLLPESQFATDAETISVFYNNKLVWIDNAASTGYILDPLGGPAALTSFEVDFAIYELRVSPLDGQLWANYVDAGVAKSAPLFKITGIPSKFTWESQYIQFDTPVSLAWLQIAWNWHLQSATLQDREDAIIRNQRLRRADRFAAVGAHVLNGITLNGDGYETIYTPDIADTTPTEYFLKATVIAEPGNDREQEVFSDFITSDKPVRLDHGVKSEIWQVKLVGNARVTKLVLASTIDELRQL